MSNLGKRTAMTLRYSSKQVLKRIRDQEERVDSYIFL